MSKAVASVTDLTNEALWCRSEGHEWKWVTDDTTVDAHGELMEVRRRKECRECGATGHKMIDARTWRAKPFKIDSYPDAYLLKGIGRVDRAVVYREQFSRAA